MDVMTLAGFIAGGILLYWGVLQTGIGSIFLNAHGIVIVLGGTVCATAVNTSFKGVMQGISAFVSIFRNSDMPSHEECIRVIVQMSETAHREGGLMAIQNVDPAFADGFLKRAVTVAIMSGESKDARQILEEEIRQRRIAKQESSNLYRTMGILSPMFGLMGTLLGIIQVLKNMSDPAKVGPSMALAITSAFYGIGFSNMLCVPVANKIRFRSIEETQTLELILEGVIDILSAKMPRLVEMHLRGYLLARGTEPMSATLREPASSPAA